MVVIASVLTIFSLRPGRRRYKQSRPPSPRLVVDRWNEPGSNPVESEPGAVCLCDSLTHTLSSLLLSLSLGEEGLQRWEEESE